METVTLKINGVDVTAPKGSTILEAARIAHIDIPTLCYLKEINEIGACRICVVEIKGRRDLVAACVYPASDGIEVYTHTPKVLASRRTTLQLILSNHKRTCLSCTRSGNCELQKLCNDLNIDNAALYDGETTTSNIDDSALHMYRDNSKCILCRRCIAVCNKVQNIGVIGVNERGFNTNISCAFEADLAQTSCVSCGQCINVCPTGALSEKDHTNEVLEAIQNKDKFVIVQTAPAVRAALGELFDYPIGTSVQGQMVTALRKLGFNKVFDSSFAADLTIMEEATELLDRIINNETLPLITSCCPAWVKYCEHYFPEFIPNLSSCKSPQQMFGAITKTYYANKMNLDPKDIIIVSVMPCTAKKFEIHRPDQHAAGVPDVDISITVRELASLIKQSGILFCELEDDDFDQPLGISTGASVIFGTTGGVMEAALRTASWKLSDIPANSAIDFTDVRGMEGVKEATYTIGETTLHVAVVSGLSNAHNLLTAMKENSVSYDFIEIMACPGGCVNGGGQPIVPSSIRNFKDISSLRANVLYQLDQNNPIRCSHDNPAIRTLYKEYLGSPGGHNAHQILHTSYIKRSIY